MPKWIAAALVAGWFCVPLPALAASERDWPADGFDISKEQALIVGAGIVGGALVLHFVIPGDFTYFAGGIAGGLAALWWYENGGEAALRPLLNPDRTAAAAKPRFRPIVQGLALAR